VPIFMYLISFGLYSQYIGNLSVIQIFTVISLFKMMRWPIMMFIFIMVLTVSLKASLNRVSSFLLAD